MRPPIPMRRPFEPGRAEPPVPIVDDLEEFVAPPIPGKVHPPTEMGDAIPTLDDPVRHYRHHPNDNDVTEFGYDREAADAAADLAGDLGSNFLEGATRGEDMSELVVESEDRADNDVPFLIETEDEELTTDSISELAAPEVEEDEEMEPETRRIPRKF